MLLTAGFTEACGGDGSSQPASTNDADGGTASALPDASSTATNDIDASTAPTSTVSTEPVGCSGNTLDIAFSPMYSAFIPGSTAHSFQVPAVATDGNAATWSVSDPTQAQLVAQNFGDLSGVMITVQGVGTNGVVTITASRSDGTCGSATLNITSATEDDWQIGDARYNDGVSIALGAGPGDGGMVMRGPRDGGGPDFRTSDGGSFYERAGGTACTNCHGPTATTGPYKDVSHTPEQTGGFSDDDLIGIITRGEVPDGGYFDPTVIDANCDGGTECTQRALNTWHAFHQWNDIGADQYPGIIAYLRSLQPEAQTGTAANFGGRGRPMGRGDGGFLRGDAGR